MIPKREYYLKDSEYYLAMAKYYEDMYPGWDDMLNHYISMAANWETWESRHSGMWDS